jgi:hypothetical protein
MGIDRVQRCYCTGVNLVESASPLVIELHGRGRRITRSAGKPTPAVTTRLQFIRERKIGLRRSILLQAIEGLASY